MNENQNINPKSETGSQKSESVKEDNSTPHKQDSELKEESNSPKQNLSEDSDAPKPQTSNLPDGEAGIEPQTIDMETHAHHLHKAPGKGFKHYLFEFLMLFLAVFCGFLAENQREHYIEKQRAKEFAKSLVEDLRADTLNLNKTIYLYDSLSGNIDSFRHLLREKKLNEIPGGTFYYYGDAANSGFRQPFSTATIEQLKSSGSLRYFPEKIRNLISEYDMQTQNFNLRQNNEPLFSIETKKYFEKIFDSDVMEQLYNIHSPDSLKIFMSTDFALLNNDTKLLKEYANNCFGRQVNWRSRITGSLIPLKQLATELMLALKKRYNLQ